MSHPMTEEVKALHKKLLPANIIMAIVGFVAGICILFMPWLDLRLSINPQALSDMLLETGAQARVESSYMSQEQSEEENNNEEEVAGVMELLARSIGNLPEDALTFPVNIYPMKLLGAATGTEHEVAEFIVSLVGKQGIVEHMKTIVNNLIPVFASTVISGAIHTEVNNILENSDLSEEDKELVKETLGEHTDKVTDVITTLTGTATTPSNPEKAREDFKQVVSDIQNDEILNEKLGDFDIPEEDLDEIFDSLVEAGTNEEGVFDLSYLLSNIENINMGSGSESGGDESNPAEPSKAVVSFMEAAGEGAEEGAGEGAGQTPEQEELQDLLNLLNDPATGLENLLKDSGIDIHQIQPVLLIVFFILMGLPACLWLLFGLFATLHIFTQKKTTATWYVKMLGFASFSMVLMLNLLPSIMMSAIGGALGSGATTNAISIKFLGSGVVVAVCWVVLVLLGWFYYKPLKKKIKLATAQAKYAAANGYPTAPVAPIAPTVVNASNEDEKTEEETESEEVDEVIEIKETEEETEE